MKMVNVYSIGVDMIIFSQQELESMIAVLRIGMKITLKNGVVIIPSFEEKNIVAYDSRDRCVGMVQMNVEGLKTIFEVLHNQMY